MFPTSVILTLPVWIDSFLSRRAHTTDSIESRMMFVISLAEENIKRKSGGPFAAAVFNSTTGALVSAGVNRVVPCNCSSAHAEIMALSLAQQYMHTYSLSSEPDDSPLELVTSTEPCAMCLGAIPWSGIKKVYCGATDADARAFGFNEGLKPEKWLSHLKKQGIEINVDICRSEAIELFKKYSESGAPIYNG